MTLVQSKSPKVEAIVRGLNLTRTLFVSTIIYGEKDTGKRTLVRHLFPELPVADGSDTEKLERTLGEHEALIIENFHRVSNMERLDFGHKRIIALADSTPSRRQMDEKFAFIYHMPSLRDRPEDLPLFSHYFLEKACRDLMIDSPPKLDNRRLDVGHNLRSLRASVYRQVMLLSADASELEQGLHALFQRNLEGNNAYRELLGIFERPLLRAGLQRYGSQLKLAQILGINRNTLRKKLHEHAID